MAGHETEPDAETTTLPRREGFEIAFGEIQTAHQALTDAVAEYDAAKDIYVERIKGILVGSRIVISRGTSFQRCEGYEEAEEWIQESTTIASGTELHVDDATVLARREYEVPISPIPHVLAEATVLNGDDMGSMVKFWLNNADWSFVPEDEA